MRLEKETSIYQLGAIAADIGAATTLAKGKNKIFYQDTAPATSMNEGDLWFKVDSSGGSSLYEYKKIGSNPDTYAWTLRQLGQGSLVAGSVTANEISVNDLSAISANLGSVNVGGVNDNDGVITVLDANGNPIGYWNNTGINAQAGTIGPWTIGATGIYNGLTSLSGVMNGTYIGTDGIAGATSNGLVRYELTPDGHLDLKDYKENGSINVGIRLDAKVGGTFGEYILVINPNNITGIYVDSNNVNHNPLIADFARGIITFDTGTDVGVLKNVYNNTTYNLIRNHSNGNISISASSGALYLGYENTTFVDLLHGCHQFGTYYTEITNANSPVWLRVRNAVGGNGIFIQANTDGTVEVASNSANGTRYGILKRANNSNDITAYGAWTFNNGVVGYNYTGRPVVSLDTDTARCSMLAANGTHVLTIQGQWNSSSYSTQNVTVSSSDIRLKEKIKDSKVEALPFVNSIKVREFDWKQDGKHQTIGVVADELEELDKNLAVGGGKNEDGTMNIKSVDTFYLMGYLVKAVQELSAEVDRLKGVA